VFRRLLDRSLTNRWLPLFLVAVSLLLVLPSVWSGWQLDDISHRYFLLGYPDFEGKTWSPLEMFSFLQSDTVRTRGMMDLGLLPWWTEEHLRLSFWRPLTGITHWLDYALWPNNAVLMHLQNLFWFGLLIAAVTLLYRNYLGLTWATGLAALLYAIDDAHGLPAGWLAGRNTIIAPLFGVLALLIHQRWRQKNWRPGAFLGSACFVLGLLAGEAALATAAYLAAFAFFLDEGSRRERVLSLVPYALITVVYLFVYNRLGHGTWGSGFYVDPIAEPLTFAGALLGRAPVLLLDQFGFPPSAIYFVLTPEQRIILSLGGLVVISLLFIMFFPLLRRDRTARFWGVGLLLSLPLVCATYPNGRLLFFVGLGGMGLIAQWLAEVRGGAAWLRQGLPWRLLRRAVVVLFILVHVIIAPLLLPLNSLSAVTGKPYLQDAAATIPMDPELEKKTMVIVNAPVIFYSNYIAPVRILNGERLSRRLYSLAPGSTTLYLERPDAQTLTIRPEGGYLAYPFDDVFRGPANPMHLGQRVELAGMTVVVQKLTEDGRPDEVAFTFDTPLEDDLLMWLRWKEDRYVRYVVPPVGSKTVIPAVQLKY